MNTWVPAKKRQAPSGSTALGSRSSSVRSVPPSKPPPAVPPQPDEMYGPEIAPVNVKGDKLTADKATDVIGGSKRSSKNSREESEAVLAETSNTAAGKIAQALTARLQALPAFEKVAFAMAGQNGAALQKNYLAATGGRTLVGDLTTAFSKSPGKRAAEYLLDCLAHDGMPSLRARMWVIFGEVDGSGSVARALAKAPKIGDLIGNAGDAERIVELFEAAKPAERIDAWLDPVVNERIRKIDSKSHRRIQKLLNVDDAQDKVDASIAGGGSATVEKRALAERRDEQLAEMVRSYTKAIPGTGKIVEVVDKLTTKKGAPGREQSWQNISFKAKDFYDDLVDWKSTASAEDIAQIKKPDSQFNIAMALVPKNAIMGLTKSERAFIFNLGGSADSGGTKTQTKAVSESLARQKNFVERGDGSGAWLVSQLKVKVGGRKWRDLATEIKLLSSDQRKEMLDEYDLDPKKAIPMLEADLRAAGFDKEGRAETIARFNTDFGTIGDNYAELWQVVNPGKTTKLKTVGAHLSPTKWTKMGEAFSGEAKGTKAKKIIYELEDNEFALVRQDKALLAAIRACSSDKTWAVILDLLGMSSQDDQLQLTSTRETVHKARLEGEVNPKRFAILLDDAIGEEKVLKGVSAGRDKAALYNVADRAMNAAKLKAREDSSDPVVFLNACLDQLASMDRGNERVAYLQKRVPQVYAAFKSNTPIPVADRFARAKHEGFGVGSLRKVDRQKLQWSFKDLTGKQLLDEWSNVDEFVAMNKASKAMEAKIAAATEVLTNPPAKPTPDDQAKQQKASADLATYSSMVGELYGQMNTFTVGIKRSRRAEFKKIGVDAEDRISFEALVSDKLVDAMDEDPEVQAIFDEIKLPYDDFMRAKMKGVDALEMQRYLDSTRQWHVFSTKTSELSEATRNVKGGAVGTEQRLQGARAQGKSADEISEIRTEGAETTETALADRTMVEARFRDMQATLRQRAMLLFKLIALAIITGVVAGATYGAGTPLAIALHVALEMGFNALQAAYSFYVLGDKDLKRIAAEFAIGVLDSTVRILTMNLAMGLNQSLLHPSTLPPGLEWVATPIAKSIGKVIHGTVMFVPQHILEQAFHDKDLESVIKEGELSIADEALAALGKQATGFMTKMLVGAAKQGMVEVQGGQSKAETAPPPKEFGQAMNDRMAGGGSKEEQTQMWEKYEKEKQVAAATAAAQMLVKGPVDTHQKAAATDAHKAHLKEMRDKDTKSAAFQHVGSTILNDQVKLVFRKARGEQFLTLLAAGGVGVLEVRGLQDDEKDTIEKDLHMTPGRLDRELRLSPDAEAGLRALAPFHGTYDDKTIPTLVASGAISTISLMRIKRCEQDHVALAAGVTTERLVNDLKREGLRRLQAKNAHAPKPGTSPPTDESQKSSSRPPNRPPPKAPTKRPGKVPA